MKQQGYKSLKANMTITGTLLNSLPNASRTKIQCHNKASTNLLNMPAQGPQE